LRTIVLFTASYPYSIAVENTFLEEELYYLNKYFKVFIVPLSRKGTKSDFIVKLDNITVYEDLPQFSKRYFLKIIDIDFLKELRKIKSFKNLKKMISYYAAVKWIYQYIDDKLSRNEWKQEYIYYTFWFNHSTTALSLLKKRYDIYFLSRVHGGDLFFEVNNDYIPFRTFDIVSIDKVIAVSKYGYIYLNKYYALYRHKFDLIYLLSKDYKVINPPNNEEVFKVVSCALVSPLKKIDEIIRLLYKFNKIYKIKIEYTHIGDGIDFEKIKKLSKEFENNQYQINLTGFKNIDEIMEFYKQKSFDVFVTLSQTEGGVPFALREAASCEIPLIGTKVGGIPEIILENYNGFLIDKDFKDDIVLATFYKMYNLKFSNEYLKFRKHSREIFLKKYEAKKNHIRFIEFLKGIR